MLTYRNTREINYNKILHVNIDQSKNLNNSNTYSTERSNSRKKHKIIISTLKIEKFKNMKLDTIKECNYTPNIYVKKFPNKNFVFQNKKKNNNNLVITNNVFPNSMRNKNYKTDSYRCYKKLYKNNNNNKPLRGKYIVETVKIEVFCKPDKYNNYLKKKYHNNPILGEKISLIRKEIWKKNLCRSSIESLCCLGNKSKI